jgi:hypothetical protein
MGQLTQESWVREVRRLCEALEMGDTVACAVRAATGEISLTQRGSLPLAPVGKAPRLAWLASCNVCRIESDSAEAAMNGLLTKLASRLDELIKSQTKTLDGLQDARRRGLKIVGGE